LTSPDP